MPKDRKETRGEFILRMKGEFPRVFRSDGSVLFCTYCECVVQGQKIFQVKQHIASSKHKVAVDRRKKISNNAISQSLIPNHQPKTGPNLREFNLDLCKTFVEANIPLSKVNHSSLVQFIEKYTTHSVPDESTLRRNYVPHLYNEKIEKLRNKADGKYIWITLDETTDVEKRSVANFLFGILDDESENGKSYLLNVKELEKCNANSIATFFNESLILLWPKGIQYDKVMLVTTDSAAYMICAMKSLRVLFPKMLHVTCFVHGLHRLGEFIRSHFSDVNNLISKVKAVFVKSPARRHLFKEKYPNTPLPPEPIATRWGSWLEACEYYADHFVAVKSIIDDLNVKDAECIREAKKILAFPSICHDLAFIKANFMFVVHKIKQLETKGLEMKKCVDIYEEVRSILNSMEDKDFHTKFEEIIARNVNYNVLVRIKDILNENVRNESHSVLNEYIASLMPYEIALFKFAVVTSVDVERSFSTYKSVLSEKRPSFTFEHLKHHLVLTCNKDLL